MGATLTAPGVISPADLYRIDELRARLALGDWAWREFRRKHAGRLKLIVIGRRKYVRGSNIIDLLTSQTGVSKEV